MRNNGIGGWRILATAVLLSSVASGGFAQAMKGSSGMSGHSNAPVSSRSAEMDFMNRWKNARSILALTEEQKEQVLEILKTASGELVRNWTEIDSLSARERTSPETENASLKKRIELAYAERDLIIAGAETDLRDFLSPEKTELVVTAAFHGVSPAHIEETHPMTMNMGMGTDPMKAMSPYEEHGMMLADAALRMNIRMRAESLVSLIRELSGK